MRLKKILKDVEIISTKNFKNYNIKSITHISNDVIGGGMFICIKGANFDGNDYIDDAISKGAKCIITETDVSCGVTVVVVKDIRKTMSIIAKNFYNRCVDSLKLVGIVGTSGKTTTSLIIGNILSKIDNNIGIIGTNGIFIGNIKISNKFTTPDPIDLHYIFYQMKSLGVKTIVMEVSAQAISLKKLYGIKFDICVFTNITQEHLDFFDSMEKYVRCKMDFFDKQNMRECVINIDDFYGRELAYKTNVPCISYGVKSPANSFAIDIQSGLQKLKFTANILDDIMLVDTSLIGDFNVYNLLAGMTVAKMLGVDAKDILSSVNSMSQIPGRLNVFEKDDKTVIVDFAHTPDSFEKTLSFLRPFVLGKLYVIFGCVGYSDKQKRMDMGLIANKYSDSIILTTDNRDFVNFEDICKDIKIEITKECTQIEDRKTAIKKALSMLNCGDVLCVLGKGAEDFQKVNGKRCEYSDLDVVKELLNKKD